LKAERRIAVLRARIYAVSIWRRSRLGGEEEKLEMAKVRLYSAEVSRRNMLRGVACAAAGVALVTATDGAFAAKPKKSQADVAYQGSPHGSERCDNCEPFIPPNKCRTVEGTVIPQGWCKIYVAK
jgi:hypothetical protein